MLPILLKIVIGRNPTSPKLGYKHGEIWGGGIEVFTGKTKVGFALVVSWVQSFLLEIRLHKNTILQR